MFLYWYFTDSEFFPFGSVEGEKKLSFGIVTNEETSAELKLPSKFPFFGKDEDTLYVSFKVDNFMFIRIEPYRCNLRQILIPKLGVFQWVLSRLRHLSLNLKVIVSLNLLFITGWKWGEDKLFIEPFPIYNLWPPVMASMTMCAWQYWCLFTLFSLSPSWFQAIIFWHRLSFFDTGELEWSSLL